MEDVFDLNEEVIFDLNEVQLQYRIFFNLLNLAQLNELNERIKNFNSRIHNSLEIKKDRFKL